ncbi:MAG: ABC transporter permease [Hyphomicrobiales bacterium]
MSETHFNNPPATGSAVERISAMVLRHWYLLKSSPPRIIDLIYWPTVQLFMWGFLQTWLAGQSGKLAVAGGSLIGAMLLWDVLFRGQIGFNMSFLEELWSRNLGHLMVSPLRPHELLIANCVMSILRVMIGLIPVTIMAIYYFGFDLYALGLWSVAFFFNLMLTGWAIGMFVCGILLRYGLGAEHLAWSLIFILLTLCCVYYPVSALPSWLQPISLALAPTHVFEGLRSILIDHEIKPSLMVTASVLNVIYVSLGIAAFFWFYRDAQRKGTLLSTGE